MNRELQELVGEASAFLGQRSITVRKAGAWQYVNPLRHFVLRVPVVARHKPRSAKASATRTQDRSELPRAFVAGQCMYM